MSCVRYDCCVLKMKQFCERKKFGGMKFGRHNEQAKRGIKYHFPLKTPFKLSLSLNQVGLGLGLAKLGKTETNLFPS